MSKHKDSGTIGEKEIIDLIPCLNCNKKLMNLPQNYPLVDVQCTVCYFRAQVKTLNSKPKDSTLGAGWDIMNKVLKSGYMTPPTFFNFKWDKGLHQEIRFYPFIPKKNLKKYKLSPKAKRANYKMFHYVGLNKIPYFRVYKK